MGSGVALLILLATSALTTLGFSSSASAASITAAAAATPKTVFYLDIGASVSVGVQPTFKAPRGQPTHRGYANRLVTYEAVRGVTLQLTQLGCPGESTTTMMLGGDKCYRTPDNQLADAVAFLSAHYGQTGLVTLDLGFNDIAPCLRSMTVDNACVSQNLELLQRQLPEIIASLKAVAGPNVTFIGLNHYNPYLAAALDGSKGTQFASDSVAALLQLNDVLQQVYSVSDIPLANVVESFQRNTPHTAEFVKGRPVPTSAIQACSLTWMCRQGPYGANLHPNNAGYRAITDAITELLPKW